MELLGELAELKRIVAAQRDEIARLKGLKGRPSIEPNGMENATEPKPGGKRAKRRGRGKVTPRVAPPTKVLRVAVPQGSQFKGYEPYQVQDLVLTARVMCYRRERWLTPDGETIVAPLPGGIRGHFGPELRRFVLMQYHQGQVTVERLVTLLQAIGVSISKRQVMRLLIDEQDDFLTKSREVLRAGLETADWVTVDDTGARHGGANAVCHADRQRHVRLVRHHGQQESSELPRPAARRSHRLCDQRRGPGLHGRSRAGWNAPPREGVRRDKGSLEASIPTRAIRRVGATIVQAFLAVAASVWCLVARSFVALDPRCDCARAAAIEGGRVAGIGGMGGKLPPPRLATQPRSRYLILAVEA